MTTVDDLECVHQMMQEAREPLLAILREVEEYLDDRADVDDGIPNAAMRLLVDVKAA